MSPGVPLYMFCIFIHCFIIHITHCMFIGLLTSNPFLECVLCLFQCIVF